MNATSWRRAGAGTKPRSSVRRVGYFMLTGDCGAVRVLHGVPFQAAVTTP